MRGIPALLAAFALAAAAAVAGKGADSPAASAVTFRDVTQQSGIHFVHNNGAFGKKFLPETLGPGVAFIDYDNDGWPDIFLVNGMDWPGHTQKHTTPKLYHNNHDGTFTDVTHKAGLDVEMYGMGVAVGDYDNDGFDDLFVTALGQSRLFHNNRNGTFTDVTQKAGLSGPRELSTSAAWVDYDKDGRLDLVVLHAGWQKQIVLHTGILQGNGRTALAQSGRRHV
jgi:enediyne biosynthesis protein E4